MFASDYPHWDGAWPQASSELLEHNQGRMTDRPGPGGGGQRPPFLRPALGGPAPSVLGVGRGQRPSPRSRGPWCAPRDPTRSPPGRRGTPSQFATSASVAALAAPSTGGARIHSSRRVPSHPRWGCDARGWTWTVMRIGLRPSPCHGHLVTGTLSRAPCHGHLVTGTLSRAPCLTGTLSHGHPVSRAPCLTGTPSFHSTEALACRERATAKAPRPVMRRPPRDNSTSPGPVPVKARLPAAAVAGCELDAGAVPLPGEVGLDAPVGGAAGAEPGDDDTGPDARGGRPRGRGGAGGRGHGDHEEAGHVVARHLTRGAVAHEGVDGGAVVGDLECSIRLGGRGDGARHPRPTGRHGPRRNVQRRPCRRARPVARTLPVVVGIEGVEGHARAGGQDGTKGGVLGHEHGRGRRRRQPCTPGAHGRPPW